MEPTSFLATKATLPNTVSNIQTHRFLPCRLKPRYRSILGPNQVCTLFGSTGGSTAVSGRDYLSVGYGLNVDDLWRRNFTVLLGFFIAFQITQMLLIEYYPVRRGPRSFN